MPGTVPSVGITPRSAPLGAATLRQALPPSGIYFLSNNANKMIIILILIIIIVSS